MTGQRFAFEPFASLDGVLRGEPIRIMPVGKFYRGERELDITPDRLRAIAANFKSGLPRFRVPINENHAGVGKVGTVTGIEYVENGADGPGLYATGYELTDEGQKLIKTKRFDATSPEIVWSLLDGAKYQDPQTGEYHDNVMVGLALTDRPYFSHDNVALFSAISGTDKFDWVTIAGRHILLPGGGGGEGGGGGGGGGLPAQAGGGGSSAGERATAHKEFKFLNKRLAAGDFKPGEKALLERRQEKLAKIVLGVKENTSAGLTGVEVFMEMTPELNKILDEKMKNMTDEQIVGHMRKMKDMSPAECLRYLESFAADMPEGDMGMMKKVKKMLADMMALFDEKPAPEQAGADPPVTDAFRTFTAEQRREFAAKGWAMPDGGYPIENTGDLQNAIGAIGRGDAPHSQIRRHIIKRAKALGAMEMLPEDWRDNMSIDKPEVDDMADKTTTAQPAAPVTPAAPAPETFTVKPEEFAALKEKAAQVDNLTAQLGEVKTQADKFRADLDAERKARRHDQLVEKFSALVAFPEKPETLADTVLKLEGMDAEVAKTVTGWIEAADKALVQAGLFSQAGSARGESPAESFEALVEQLHKEKFNSAPEKYNDALELAGKQRPDLMRAYIGH